MAGWTMKSWAETLGNTVEEEFKISELKEKFDIQVSQEELKKYADTFFSMKEVQKIKTWVHSVSELAKSKLDILKNKVQQSEAVKNSQKLLSQRTKQGAEYAKQSISEANETLSKQLNDSWVSAKAKQIWQQTKVLANKWVEKIKGSGFLLTLEKVSKEWWFLGFLAWLLLWMFKFIGFGKKIEDIKEKLSNKEIDKTKNIIKTTLIESFPSKEEYINKVLNNPKILTEEKITLLYKKIKSWEKITLNDLTDEFKELEIWKILAEKVDKYKNELYSNVQKDIELKYNKKLDDEQVVELGKLIAKYLTVDKWNIELLEDRIVKDNQIQLKDIAPIITETGKNLIGFMLWLVSANIISIGDLAMNFAEKWWEVIKLSLWALWISEVVNIDDLYSNISEMEEKDKAILIWLLYRKWWLFLNIVWSITSVTSKLIIETILPTNSWVDWIKLIKDSILHWNVKQIENFGKIEKALKWSKVTSQWEILLKEAMKNIKEVKTNFAILEIMKSSNWDLTEFYKQAAKFEANSNIKLNVKQFASFEELKTWVSSDFSKSYASKHNLDIRDIKNKWLWFWSNSAIQELNKKLENIWKNQWRIALWKINLNPLKKLTDAIDIGKVSKLWDSLLFELRSKKDAKAFLKQMNELAKKSPALLKGIFDKLPIIAIWGLAASWEEPFFESFKKELPYLIPLVWPILMVADSWVDWGNIPPKFIKPEQAAIAWAMLTLDTYFLAKAWFKWAPGYILKPLKDIYDIWKWWVQITQNLYKTWRVLENWKTMKSVLNNAVNKTKALKWKVKAITIIALIWYWAFKLAFADDNTSEFEKYFKDWELDIDKIKSDSESLSNQEKLELIKILFVEEKGEKIIEDIEFNLELNNTLSIISNNKEVQWEWFITNNIKKTLYNMFLIENYIFEYKKQVKK